MEEKCYPYSETDMNKARRGEGKHHVQIFPLLTSLRTACSLLPGGLDEDED